MGAEVKFKAGDRVRLRVKPSRDYSAKAGELAEVYEPTIKSEIEWIRDGTRVCVKWVDRSNTQCDGGYRAADFELVEPAVIQSAEPPCTHTDVAAGKSTDSIVNRPSHYTRYAIEPIEFIMKNKLEFWRGCVVKYTARAGHKLYDGMDAVQSEIVDHKKSIRYLEMRVKELEGNTEFAK